MYSPLVTKRYAAHDYSVQLKDNTEGHNANDWWLACLLLQEG